MRAMLEVTIRWGETVLHVERVPRGAPHQLGGPCRELWADTPLPMPETGDATVALDDGLTLVVSAFDADDLPRERPSRRWLPLALFGVSSAFHLGLFVAMFVFPPPLAITPDEELTDDRVAMMKQLLQANAEREDQAPRDVAPADEVDEGGSGAEARGEAGSMGAADRPKADARYAVRGPAENPDPHIARVSGIEEAQTSLMIDYVHSLADPSAPTAPWGRDDALGTDPVSARGNLWGDANGDSFGAGGLSLSGVGAGGGGRVVGIGIGAEGVLGHGAGFGSSTSIGNLAGYHRVGPSVCRCGRMLGGGRLPPEVIQRVVRQSFGRFRVCYEKALLASPSLAGTVKVAFVIGLDGSVKSASNAGSDMPDASVTSCVVRAFGGLAFPEPEGGVVRVTYPISFSPAG